MSQVIKIILLTIFCQTYILEIRATQSVFEKYYSFAYSPNMITRYAYQNERLLFVACYETSNSSLCYIVEEKLPYGNPARECYVSLPFDRAPELSQITINPLGTEKAIISWDNSYERTNTRLTTINMTDCQFSDNTLLLRNFNSWRAYSCDKIFSPWRLAEELPEKIFSSGDDEFEVFIESTSRCDKKIYRFTMDSEVREKYPLLQFFEDIRPSNKISNLRKVGLTNEYVYIEAGKLYLTGYQRKSVLLYRESDVLAISTANEKLGACSKDMCIQYKLKSSDNDTPLMVPLAKFWKDFKKRKFNSSKPIPLSKYNANLRNMYNLPEGGFLLLIESRRDTCRLDECFSLFDGLHLIKFDATGKKIGMVNLKGYRVDERFEEMHLWGRTEEQDYCVMTLQRVTGDLDSYLKKMIANCVNDSDFL